MRLCYFGGYDLDHPRNRVMIAGLRRSGAHVVECHSRRPSRVLRALTLAASYWQRRGEHDLVLVAASGQRYLPLGWLLARATGKPLVFDAFVSFFEARTEEPAAGAFSRARGWALDRLGTSLADVVLTDTEEHAAYYRDRLGVPASKIASVPVGADSAAFVPREVAAVAPLHVLFAASFLPLHGTGVVLQAAALLGRDDGIRIEVIGADDEERRRLRSSSPGPHLELRPRAPYVEYAATLAGADVALGAFGTTAKAGRVIPCKVWDALAAGVALVTGDTPAVRRLVRHERDALLVPPGDARALAGAIRRLRDDPGLRARLARAGRRTFDAVGTPDRVGRLVLGICAGMGRRAPATRAPAPDGASAP